MKHFHKQISIVIFSIFVISNLSGQSFTRIEPSNIASDDGNPDMLFVQQVTVSITFQADMTDLFESGFNPIFHNLELRGSFNNWASGDVLQPDSLDDSLYIFTKQISGNEGDVIDWKFKAHPDGDFSNNGWEIYPGTGEYGNRHFTLPSTDLTINVVKPDIILEDTNPPVLKNFSIFPAEVSNGYDTIRVAISVADSIAGISDIEVRFRPASSSSSMFILFDDIVPGISHYTGTGYGVVQPSWNEGIWSLWYVQLWDRAGNEATYSANDLAGMGFDTSFVVYQNTSVPELHNFSISPTEIDVTPEADTIEVSLSVSDGLGLRDVYLYFMPPSGNTSYGIYTSQWPGFTAGLTTYTGTADLIIPKGVIPGEWSLSYITVVDMSSNYTQFYPSDLDTLGFQYVFNVISIEDTIPPTLNELSIFPTAIDVTSGSDSVSIYIDISDENSGLSSISARFISPSGMDEVVVEYSDFTSGLMSYTGSAYAIIPQFVEGGEWRLDYLSIRDLMNNYRAYYASDMDSLGLPYTFNVISENDVEGPVLNAFSFFPTELEPSEDYENWDTVQVQLSISDDISGLASISVRFTSPIDINYNYVDRWTYFPDFIPGEMNYTGTGVVTFYPYRTGAWICSITLTDQDDNVRYYNTTELENLGFPPSIAYGHAGPVFHVTPEGDDIMGDGSPETPFATIVRAIESTQDGDTVLVSDGIYTGEGNRDIRFPTKYIKSIVVTSENGPENTIIDCENESRGVDFYCGSRDCWDRNTVLNGFTIQNGLPQLPYYNYGGGISVYSFGASPIISNMIIKNCSAEYGGGIYILDVGWEHGLEEAPLILNCRIEDNNADESGGGIYIRDGQDINGYAPVLVNCSIINNTAGEDGGGIYFSQVKPYLFNCLIAGNSSAGRGGGIFSYGTIYSNVINRTFLQLENCTLASNDSPFGSAIYGIRSSNTLHNSIIWNNELGGDYFHVSYSDVQGGWSGEYNINSNPLFVEPDSSDYSLQAESPCLDAGNPTLFFNDTDGSRNDMGISGGRLLLPSFYSHDFGEVGINSEGLNQLETSWELANLQEDPLEITSASFSTDHFSLLNATFPIIIPPYTSDSLKIRFQPLTTGELHDSLTINIANLGTAQIEFQGQGISNSTLYGNLNGVLAKTGSPYLVLDDIIVLAQDSLIIEPGVEIRFTDRYKFDVYGYINATGNQQDSILFTGRIDSVDSRWWGIRLFTADDNSILSYCKIENGKAKTSGWGYSYEFRGGGLYISSTAITVTHCTISNNQAYDGGGIAVSGYKIPRIFDCVISHNIGGGIACFGASPIIENCSVFNNNGWGFYVSKAAPLINNCYIYQNDGAGIKISGASPLLTDVTILGNDERGVYIEDRSSHSAPVFKNCLIAGNKTYSRGGAIYCQGDSSKPVFINCTITDNYLKWGNEGGGIYTIFGSNILLVNTILYNNTPNEIYLHDEYPSNITLAYSNIESGLSGIEGDTSYVTWLAGNIESDPLFADTVNAVYSLNIGSSAIDAGTSMFVWEGDTLINLSPDNYFGTAPDMGAYETYLTAIYAGDTDNNGIVDAMDVLPIGVYFQQIGSPRISVGINWEDLSAVVWNEPAATYADASGDGIVDEKDVIAIGVNWGNTHETSSSGYAISLIDTARLQEHQDAFREIYNSLSGDSKAVRSMKSLLRIILNIQIPEIFSLSQNYPNPFNPNTTIRYTLPKQTKVNISIYNIRGQLVNILESETKEAGYHQVVWRGDNNQGKTVSAGMYFYRLVTNDYTATKKMILLK